MDCEGRLGIRTERIMDMNIEGLVVHGLREFGTWIERVRDMDCVGYGHGLRGL